MKVLLLAYIDRFFFFFFLSEMTHRLNKLRLYWLNFGLKNYLTKRAIVSAFYSTIICCVVQKTTIGCL